MDNSNNKINIYIERGFHPNIKCIIISAIFATLYWILPHKNIVVMFMIIFIMYIALAWYDHLYDCSEKMLSGNLGINPQSIFKPSIPKKHIPDGVEMAQDQEYIRLKTIYTFHLFIIAPLMIYCGMNINGNPDAFALLSGFGGLAGLYHGSKFLGF